MSEQQAQPFTWFNDSYAYGCRCAKCGFVSLHLDDSPTAPARIRLVCIKCAGRQWHTLTPWQGSLR